jgi:hypothetical protein
MRRVISVVLVFLILGAVAGPRAWAAETEGVRGDRSPGSQMAAAITTVTGIAISPLLGTGAYGAYLWWSAEGAAARERLPWFAQVQFWLPALCIVGICAAKDAFGAVVPPGWKKPLDVLETIENKASGLIAAGVVIPVTMAHLSKSLAGTEAMVEGGFGSSGLAMVTVGAIDFSWLLNVVTVPLGIAVFAVVWMASHAINVLILLSPWGAIDAALKSARTGLLGLLTVTATLEPWVAAGLSVVVIIVAWLVAGWAFRLTVFGWVFSWDFLTLRRLRFRPRENDNAVFAGGQLGDVPVRTYGRLRRKEGGGLEFVYRPRVIGGRVVRAVPGTQATRAVGCGLFFSSVTNGEDDTLFLLPPRYRGHEESLVATYELGGGVRPAGLRKAWSVMRELFGGKAAQTQVV